MDSSLWLLTGLTVVTARFRIPVVCLLLPIAMWLVAHTLASAEVCLVKDIQPGPGGSSPGGEGVILDGSLLFSADDGTGTALWKSDGICSGSGTSLVKEVEPCSGPNDAVELEPFAGAALFVATDATHGCELWRTDGTETGTQLLKDIHPGIESSLEDPTGAVLGDLYLFAADDGVHGCELWGTDGTEAGTQLVKDIAPGLPSSRLPPCQLEAAPTASGRVFFAVDNGASGCELWKSDGTERGTELVKSISLGAFCDLEGAESIGGTLFFSANDGTTGQELWKSEGTALSTMLVEDIRPGSVGSIEGCDGMISAVVGDKFFFGANDGVSGHELWKSDGTASGTLLVKDIWPGPPGSSICREDGGLADLNGTLLLIADNGASGRELWRSDGSEPGTWLVKDIWPGSSPNDGVSGLGEPVGSLGVRYFPANDGVLGQELWRTNGESSGTLLAADINSGPGHSFPTILPEAKGAPSILVHGALLMAADRDDTGRELWALPGVGAPPGVPSGLSGEPMTVDKLDPDGTALSISWDTTTCTDSADHLIVFGGGSQLSTYSLDGSECNLGYVSPYVWHDTPDPATDPMGFVWWLIVATDGATTEGSWGEDTDGIERSGPGPDGSSGECGITGKDLTNTCGQ